MPLTLDLKKNLSNVINLFYFANKINFKDLIVKTETSIIK